MDARMLDRTGFEKADEAGWRRLVDKALKGAGFDETLVSHTDDGIAYGPIGGRRLETRLNGRFRAEQPWTVSQRVDDPDLERSLQQMAADLDGGANGITLCLEGAPAAYGFGVPADRFRETLRACGTVRELRLEAQPEHFSVIAAFFAANERDEACHTDFGIPHAMLHDEDAAGTVDELFDLDIDCTIFRADGRLAHNAGASEAQELGFALAAITDFLRFGEKNGIGVETVLAATEIVLAADQDQFVSIAKLRAMRQLHARLQEILAIDEPCAPDLHAETSFRMLTRLDPETNILRNTIAVFAAGIGGADSVSVLPHTLAHGLPDRFARRIARNTQTVLIDESHLAHVVDPAAGAGAVEDLTDALAERGWHEFRRIENEGGLLRSIDDKALPGRIAEMREKRQTALTAGTRRIVGTTVYAAKDERPVSVLTDRQPDPAADGSFAPVRLDQHLKAGDAA